MLNLDPDPHQIVLDPPTILKAASYTKKQVGILRHENI